MKIRWLFSFLIGVHLIGVAELPKDVYFFAGAWGKVFPDSENDFGRDDSLACTFYLKKRCVEKKIFLHDVSTIKGISTPLAVISFEKPSSQNLEEILQLPYESRILFIWEPPPSLRGSFDRELHKHFVRVYTWDDDLVDNKKYFKLYYPVMRKMIENLTLFEEKKLCCAISGNHFSPHPDQLYSERIKAYTFYDRVHPTEFDLFGMYWNSGQFKTYRGTIEKKVDTFKKYKFCICYENTKNHKGYITEKIFDAFHAGCIPVYLGAPNITEYVPENCFIDRRKFSSDQEVYDFLKAMTKTEYESYIQNIRKYLNSPKAQLYSIEYFIETMTNLFEMKQKESENQMRFKSL